MQVYLCLFFSVHFITASNYYTVSQKTNQNIFDCNVKQD